MAQSRLLVDQVSRIIGLESQPILRNLLITQCYHDLSSELSRVLCATNVNWCTFATWASKTAGRFIRNDEIPVLFRGLLTDSNKFRTSHQRLSRGLVSLHPETTLGEFDLIGVADVEAVESNPDILYTGTAAGGVWNPMRTRMICWRLLSRAFGCDGL